MTDRCPTKQEIFDKVATHLLAQKEPSLDDDGQCAYRGGGCLKCAIGCLIPDDLYSADMEGHGPKNATVREPRLAPLFGMGQRESDDHKALFLLEGLLCIHDGELADDWPARLIDLAVKCGLDSTVCNIEQVPSS